jgi:hypothetical protein
MGMFHVIDIGVVSGYSNHQAHALPHVSDCLGNPVYHHFDSTYQGLALINVRKGASGF